MGKTTLSRQIALPHPNALHIHAESWIHSMDYREAYGVSGSNLHAYSASTAVDELTQLLTQNKPVYLGQYSHERGRIVAKEEVRRIGNAPYILDGTLFCDPSFEHLVERVYFIAPHDYSEWFEVAVRRDVEERGFSLEDARRKNAAKQKDMIALEKKAKHAHRIAWTGSSEGIFQYDLR